VGGALYSVIVPTFRRPRRVAEAARSVLAQQGAPQFELVLVDNDPRGSALGLLQQIAADARIPVRVVHARDPGVSSARNAGLAAASGAFIVFLDDDEVASPGWLAELARVQQAHNADIVFGPVRTRLPEPAPEEHRDYFEAFFARDPDHAEGPVSHVYGCGCSLIRRAAIPHSPAFAVDRNETGGEDDKLFSAMRAAGARIAWAPQAWVWETPEPVRVTLDYTLRRAFAYGQGPAMTAWLEGRRASTLGWMAVGAGQAAVFGLASLASWIARRPRRAFIYRRAVEGLGKALWFPSLHPRLYGQSAIAAAPAQPAAS
jgi:succinoglycan biosynthesis protein ExoM